jgi:hypothetical protein
VHAPWLRDVCPPPERVLVVITWIFPGVMCAGACACFAYWIGLARDRSVETRHSVPVLARIEVGRSGSSLWRPVPSRDPASAACSGGQHCREWGGL